MTRPIEVVLARLPEPRKVGAEHWRCACPAHGGSNRTTLSVGIGQGDAVLLTCWAGCTTEAITDALGLQLADLFEPRLDRIAAPLRRPAQPIKRDDRPETLAGWALEFFRSECLEIQSRASNVAAEYLRARCCALPPLGSDLRWHPTLRHPSGYTGPALVGLITHVQSCAPMSLHRTWIRPDGTKADLESSRLFLAGHRKAEGVIRLWPDDAVSSHLGVGEGIETCLSLAQATAPVWSLMDAGNLASFPVLRGIESLTIAADHDEAGRKAADACGARWANAGATVRVVLPPRTGADLNDVITGAAA